MPLRESVASAAAVSRCAICVPVQWLQVLCSIFQALLVKDPT